MKVMGKIRKSPGQFKRQKAGGLFLNFQNKVYFIPILCLKCVSLDLLEVSRKARIQKNSQIFKMFYTTFLHSVLHHGDII